MKFDPPGCSTQAFFPQPTQTYSAYLLQKEQFLPEVSIHWIQTYLPSTWSTQDSQKNSRPHSVHLKPFMPLIGFPQNWQFRIKVPVVKTCFDESQNLKTAPQWPHRYSSVFWVFAQAEPQRGHFISTSVKFQFLPSLVWNHRYLWGGGSYLTRTSRIPPFEESSVCALSSELGEIRNLWTLSKYLADSISILCFQPCILPFAVSFEVHVTSWDLVGVVLNNKLCRNL